MKRILALALGISFANGTYAADIKPYVGLGLHSFTISSELTVSGSTAETASDSGSAFGINGGVHLNDNSKINAFYFSGEEDDSKLMEATVIGVSYDYNFNNHGVHRGFVLGGGVSSVTTEFKESSISRASSDSSVGLLLRAGYEYLMDNNIRFGAILNINTAEQEHSFVVSGFTLDTTTTVSSLALTVDYLF